MRRFYLKYSDLGIYSKVSQFLSEIYRINIKMPPKRKFTLHTLVATFVDG